MAISHPAWAQKPHQAPHQAPHGADAHQYEGAVYQNGPLLTLEEAVEKVINASPRLKSAVARLEAAKGVEDQASAWPNPEFSFEAENIAGSGQFSGLDAAEYTYGIDQTLEIGGKRSARQNAAQAARKGADIAQSVERLNLERDVHIAYVQVLAKAESLKLAIDQEKLAKGVLATVSKRVDAAAEPEIQRSKAEVAYATSVIARQQEEKQLEIAKENLVRLWGGSHLDMSLNHEYFFALQAPDAFHLYQEKLDQIPDIQHLSFAKAEKEALLDLEKAQAIPDPNFSLGVRDFRDSGDHAFLFGVSLPIPVLNQNSGNIAKARAEMMQTESDAHQARLMLEQELAENWHEYNSAHDEAKRLQDSLLPSAERAFMLARVGYEKGKFPYLEVLDAQRTLFDARAQYHEALKRYHVAKAHVERLTHSTGE